MAKKFPLHPKFPERICWGCDKYCSVNNMGCGNGSSRTMHPAEIFGDDWYLQGDWGVEVAGEPEAALQPADGKPALSPPLPAEGSLQSSGVPTGVPLAGAKGE